MKALGRRSGPDGVLWGQMAAATIVAAVLQLLLRSMVQQCTVRGLTMGAVR
jgi:ABC-type glycerol-3-phosphate transport system permease component